MEELMKAIYDKWEGNADLMNAVEGGMYWTRANPDVDVPYCVVDLVSNNPDFTFAKTLEQCRVQFSLFAETAPEITDCATKLMALFDFATLSFTAGGYTSVGLVRENSLLSFDAGYYQYVIDYFVRIYET